MAEHTLVSGLNIVLRYGDILTWHEWERMCVNDAISGADSSHPNYYKILRYIADSIEVPYRSLQARISAVKRARATHRRRDIAAQIARGIILDILDSEVPTRVIYRGERVRARTISFARSRKRMDVGQYNIFICSSGRMSELGAQIRSLGTIASVEEVDDPIAEFACVPVDDMSSDDFSVSDGFSSSDGDSSLTESSSSDTTTRSSSGGTRSSSTTDSSSSTDDS